MTISLFARVFVFILLSLPAWAQSDRPQELANGQRVEVMDGVRWVKGTVRQKLQYRPDAFDYEVLTDGGNGQPQNLRRTAPDADHIRPIQEARRGPRLRWVGWCRPPARPDCCSIRKRKDARRRMPCFGT